MIVRFCEICNQEIPQERLEVLPDTLRCVKHTNATKTEGLIEYGHKTAGVICLVPKDPEQKRRLLRAYRRAR